MPVTRQRRTSRSTVFTRPSRSAVPSGLCALVLALGPTPMAMARDSSPSPASSGSTVRLPVIPASLDSAASCTKPSPAMMPVTPWTHAALGLPASWAVTRGAGITVAVVDTGAEAGTHGLEGRVQAVGDAGDDCVGHGSFVAGLIAAAAGGSGEADLSGVAPQARILAVRGTDRHGRASSELVSAGIREAADAGAEVIAVPLALSAGSAGLRSAVRHAVARGCLVVAASVPDAVSEAVVTSAATTKPSPPRPFWPASYDGVLSVVDFGPDGTRPTGAPDPVNADLAAPGDKVVGAGPRGSGSFTGSGASFATAYVAGAAALVRARSPRTTAEQTARRLVETAYPADVPRLDTYAALTVVSHGHERGLPRRAPEQPVALPSRDDTGGRRIAFLVESLCLVTVLVAAGVRGVARARRGRRGRVTTP